MYDGHCGFCNGTVRWFLRRDGKNQLRFVPSSDPRLQPMLARHDMDASGAGPSSILAVRNIGSPTEMVATRSSAAIQMLQVLPAPWPVVAALLRIVPRPLRDLVCRLIARTRYRLAGRLESCPLPTPAERARFL